MCGVAGLIGRVSTPNLHALARMNAAMAHRGPDGSGTWHSPPDARGWGAMLAHRRLSILDLSSAAAQPMVDVETSDAVVLNGEIYNYVELRERLVAAGHRFTSSGDTAVLLRALSADGLRAVRSFRGMFAFAFWNAGERTLALARDPLGIKPLYLACNHDSRGEWALLFASEVRAILASGLLGTPALDPSAVASVVWNGFVAGPSTAESDVAQALAECVRLHLASDVPLGIFLSGGVDSSAVASLAQRASGAPVHTFTLAFDEPEYNEGQVARQVANAIGTRHQ